MKKICSLIFLLISLSFFSQIRLTDVPFSFKKSNDYHQLISKANSETNEVFSFAADKEKFFGVKFNSALFFSDSITSNKPNDFRYLMGCGFTDTNNPIAYWATNDLERFIGIEFDFNLHSTKTIQYNLNLKDQTIFADFYNNDIFYFLIEKKETKSLELVSIEGHNVIRKDLNFLKFKIENQNQKTTTLLELLEQFGITKMDTKGFNSYVNGTNAIKYYLRNDTLVISLDNTTKKTQIFEINLQSLDIKETIFNQNSLQNIKQTNSLLFENYLFQLAKSKDGFEIKILNYLDQKLVKTYTISESNPLPFTNTIFYIQTPNKTPQDLKNAKRFLKKLSNASLGASLYNFNGNYVATFGGYKTINRNSDVFVDLIGIAAGYNNLGLYGNDIQQNVYFDVTLTSDFEQTAPVKQPLYIDKIAQFTSENKNVKYEYCFPYKDYYILSFYDKNEDKIVLSKFTDGFDY